MTLGASKRFRHSRATVGVLIVATLALSACGGEQKPADPSAADPVVGGTLKYALGADLPSLDIQQTTAGVIGPVAYSTVEFLFARNSEGENIPMLAKEATSSDDGLTWTIRLREGVKFHNGETMTSDDVQSSFERWTRVSAAGEAVAARLESVASPDEQTLVFEFNKPYGSLPAAFSVGTQGLAIYPASVIERSTDSDLAELVGTGPYMLEGQDPGRSIRLVRFEDYSALPGDAPDGYGGFKPQYLDAIEFEVVTNEAARLAGLESGKYDLIHGSSADVLETLEGSRNVVVERVDPTGFQMLLINQKSSITADLKLRQAIQAALDNEAILNGGLGASNFRLDPSLSLQETEWHTTAGGERYNINDPAKAEALLAESDYNGETIRIVTSRDLTRFYNQAVVIEQQLEAVGMKVEVETYDWATALDRRDSENGWELFVTDYGVKYTPFEQAFSRGCSYVGWWCNDKAAQIIDEFTSSTDRARQQTLASQYQELVYAEVPFIKIGDTGGVIAYNERVQGVTRQGGTMILAWNVWLQE